MSGIKIRGTGRRLPDRIVTNEDLSRIVDTSDERITSRTGILRRRHCESETHTELVTGAAAEALHRAGIDPSEIGACIVATVTPDTLVPSAACRVQKTLGLPMDIP